MQKALKCSIVKYHAITNRCASYTGFAILFNYSCSPFHLCTPKVILLSIHGNRKRAHFPLLDGIRFCCDGANFIELQKQCSILSGHVNMWPKTVSINAFFISF